MENKFKKGLILGGLLIAATAIGYVMSSKEGQELSEELKEDFKPLAKNLKKNLHKLHDVTKEDFEGLVMTLVDEYAKKKELSGNAKNALVAALKVKWHEMEEEYSNEKI